MFLSVLISMSFLLHLEQNRTERDMNVCHRESDYHAQV